MKSKAEEPTNTRNFLFILSHVHAYMHEHLNSFPLEFFSTYHKTIIQISPINGENLLVFKDG